MTTLDELVPAQSLADLAVLAVLQTVAGPTAGEVRDRVRRALDRRVVVEQAKGVVAEWTGLAPAETGRLLLARPPVTG